jgi:L-iditol 2-dehydrogenase/threonine 3-dehydrogenase
VEGFQAPGAAQRHFVVTEDRIIKVDATLPYDEIAMIEPCAVAAHATSRTDVCDKNVVVTGAGTIGNLVAQFALARGAKRVLITDISDLRLVKARACGIVHTANTSKEPFEDAVQRVFGAELFQLAFEVSAAQQCVTDLVSTIEKGSDIVIVGVFSRPALVDLGVVDEHDEITLIGSMMYKHENFEFAMDLLRDGKVSVKTLITHHFKFSEYAAAYSFIDSHREECMKVIIDLPE